MPDPFEDFGLPEFFSLIDSFARRDIVDTAARIAPNSEGLAELAYNLRYAKQLLSDAAMYVEDELVKAMPTKVMVVENVGEVEYHTGSKRTAWDHDRLIGVAAHALVPADSPPLFDGATGEAVDPFRLAEAILVEFRDMATPSWKVTGLRAHGIDPGDYCETSWGRKTIDMPKPDKFIPMPHVEGAASCE